MYRLTMAVAMLALAVTAPAQAEWEGKGELGGVLAVATPRPRLSRASST